MLFMPDSPEIVPQALRAHQGDSETRPVSRQASRAIVNRSRSRDRGRGLASLGDSSPAGGRQSAIASTSIEGRTRPAGIASKMVTPPRLLPTAGADHGPAVD